MDPPTLISWLDLRRMTFDVGQRFTIRIKSAFYMMMGLVLIEGFFLFAKAFGYIEIKEVLTHYHWMVLLAHFVFSFIFVARAFVEAALTNDATKEQVEKLVSHRHLLERLLSDLPTLKDREPDSLVNRDMRKCLVYVQLQAMKNLKKLMAADLPEEERPQSKGSLDSTNAKSFWVKEKDDSEEDSEEMDFPEQELKDQEIMITKKAILGIEETI
jgi:hypothetical protein